MTFRFGSMLALTVLALLGFSGCDDSSAPYTGPGLPAGYTKYQHEPNPIVELTTTAGPIKIELFEDRTPDTVDNFVELVEKHFYDGVTFHRIIKDFMIQGGDPKGDGSGGPGYKFDDEIYTSTNKNDQYAVAMANSGKDPQSGKGTNGSQFFIVTDPKGRHHLDKLHTVFGKVIEGKDVVDKLNLTPVDPKDGQTPLEKPKILSAKVVANKRSHDYKLDEKKKQMDRTMKLGPGSYSPEEIKKLLGGATPK